MEGLYYLTPTDTHISFTQSYTLYKIDKYPGSYLFIMKSCQVPRIMLASTPRVWYNVYASFPTTPFVWNRVSQMSMSEAGVGHMGPKGVDPG